MAINLKNQFNKTHRMILCALFAALIAVGAFIKIPVPFVPFTLQTLFVTLAGLLLGGGLGATAVGIYILLGLAGLPIFTAGGGIGYVLHPTFGYIIGFLIAAYVIGTIANKVSVPSYKRLAVAVFSGLAIIYTIGTIYFYIISKFYLGKAVSVWPVILYCCIVFIPGDGLSCILDMVLAKRLIPVLNKMK